MLRVISFLCASWVLLTPVAANPDSASSRAKAADAAEIQRVEIVYLTRRYEQPQPLSLVDRVLSDEGAQGARLAVDDSNRTGRFAGLELALSEVVVEPNADIAKAVQALGTQARILVADLEAGDLRAASAAAAPGTLLFSTRADDDDLRQERCRANVLHVMPSAAMRADALAQYLAWKRWPRWLLVVGKTPADQRFAAAVRRAAGRFGGKIVEERQFTIDFGGRAETGHQQVQAQMPMLTQGAREHDVVFVADAAGTFGDYLPYRTAEPKPVVGTHGLVAVAWHRAFEQYGAMQMQSRFERAASRVMTERDYTAWLAVRMVAEAQLRTRSAAVGELRAYIMSDKFGIAGFKGHAMTVRSWDQQVRQPMLVMGARALVSISPQDGFLHPRFTTDTLGFDAPESRCALARPN